MPGNYSSANAFGASSPQKVWQHLPCSAGVKRKYEEVISETGSSLDVQMEEDFLDLTLEKNWKRSCFRGEYPQEEYCNGQPILPSCSKMDQEEYVAQPSVYPLTLYSHMIPKTYSGTPPQPRLSEASDPGGFSGDGDAGAASEHLPHLDFMRTKQTIFCQDHCRKGSGSPNSQYVRCFCRPSWEAMVATVPMGNDYY